MNYYNKYLKYKNKYLSLKNQIGKGISDGELINFTNEIYEIQKSLEYYFGEIVYLTGSWAVVLLAKLCDVDNLGIYVSKEEYPKPNDVDFILDMTEDKKLKQFGFNITNIVVNGKDYKSVNSVDGNFVSSETFKNNLNDNKINEFDLTKDFVKSYHEYIISEDKKIKIMNVSSILDNYIENINGPKEEANKLKINVLNRLKRCETIKIVREESKKYGTVRGRNLFDTKPNTLGNLVELMVEDSSAAAGAGAGSAGATGDISSLELQSPLVKVPEIKRTIEPRRRLNFNSTPSSSIGGIKRTTDSPLPLLSPIEKKSRD